MTEELATQDEGVAALLAFVYSGAIGSPKGKGVGYALAEATAPIFTWVAALEDIDGPSAPIDRYRISFNRRTRKILPPTPVVLSEQELAEAIQAATGHHLASSTRFTDGALSISYKIEVKERSDIAYILQLRHHGRVASMDALMTLISKTVDLQVLPLPQVYPNPWRDGPATDDRNGQANRSVRPGHRRIVCVPTAVAQAEAVARAKNGTCLPGLLEDRAPRTPSNRRAHCLPSRGWRRYAGY
jgi:hypothetical protein